MILRLSTRWSNKLVSLPESGMGYQKVNVRLKSGKLITGLVVQNAEELSIPVNIEPFEEEDIEDIQVAR